MDKNEEKEIWEHLDRVSKELRKLKKEYSKNPDDVGKLEHRLFWVIRGVDPHKAVCKKHNRKIEKNSCDEYVCDDCAEEDRPNDYDTYDENQWYNPKDEPSMKIRLITYGFKEPYSTFKDEWGY